MGIYFCETEGCPGYFCSVDGSFRPHAEGCEHAKQEPEGGQPSAQGEKT